jgi:hypothetical protein
MKLITIPMIRINRCVTQKGQKHEIRPQTVPVDISLTEANMASLSSGDKMVIQTPSSKQ